MYTLIGLIEEFMIRVYQRKDEEKLAFSDDLDHIYIYIDQALPFDAN